MVDTISSLGSVDYRHDEWKVDVSVSCSQKGFMLPPGLGFNAISDKARAAAKTNRMPRSYWDWEEMLKPNANGFFPYTPATNLLYGLREAIAMLLEEGLDNVFARHQRLAAATRAAVNHWGLEVLCQEPADYSPVLTAVLMPPGHDADQFRKVVLDNYNMSLGSGLSKVAGKVFRIGHLGECNELTLLGALTGVEMGLSVAGVPHRAGGVDAAMKLLGAAPAGQCAGASEGRRQLAGPVHVSTRASAGKQQNRRIREAEMRFRFKATHVVLAMLCAMYFITYVDRVNIGTAASEIQKELRPLATRSSASCSRPSPIPICCFRLSAAGSAIISGRARPCSGAA